MKKIYFLFFTLITSLSFGQVINEVDADTPGSDMAEFVEILWTPNTALDGLTAVFFNGSNDTAYGVYDLDGFTTDANGFFIIGNDATSPDISIAGNGIQNGADAVALYSGDFVSGDPVTATNFLNGVVYGTGDADDAELLAIIGGVQYDERENNASDSQSVQRNTDGTYTVKNITLRASNDAATCDLSLGLTSATCDAFTTGTDTYTATVDFSGGGTSTYTVMADSGTVDLSAGDPSTDATGTITITGVAEGTDVVITTQDGALCDLSATVFSPECTPALALPLYEGFDYTPGTDLIDDDKWSNASTSSDEIAVAAGNLMYTGLEASTGNHVIFDGTGSDPAIEFTPETSGEVFTSFIFTVTDQTAITDLSDGGYFAVLGSFDARLWVKPEVDATSTTFTIGGGSASSSPMQAAGTFNVGDAVFAVMSYNIDTGAVNVWLNPSETELASATPPTAAITEVDSSPATSIGQFVLRQDSPGETPFMQFDELRIGTSWADVTPTALSVDTFTANTFTMYPNPTNNGIVTIKSANTQTIDVAVFDILGKQVLNTELTNQTLNVSSLKSGVYLVKLTQNNASTTKKLVIK